MSFNIRSVLLGLVYALLAFFVYLNRQTIFGLPEDLAGDPEQAAEALAAYFPLIGLSQFTTGEVLLGFLGILTLLYVLFAAGLRTSSLVESRRNAKEVEAVRKLADEAEASRILALQQHIDGALEGLREQAEARHNMLAAILGELEDRLERAGLAGETPERPAAPAEPDDPPVA